MRVVRTGVTRTVLLVGRWAIKVPAWRYKNFWRGVLANQSEWRLSRARAHPDLCRPVLTLAYVVQVYPRADEVGDWDATGCWTRWEDFSGDESKADSWGRFGDRWLMLDYDYSFRDRSPLGRFLLRWQEWPWRIRRSLAECLLGRPGFAVAAAMEEQTDRDEMRMKGWSAPLG